jgi:tape measure domain-containing protein
MSNKDYRVRILLDLDTGQLVTKHERATDTIRRGGSAAAKSVSDAHVKEFKAIEREAARSAKEVQRIDDQTRKQAEQNEKVRERAAKSLADVQIRESRRAANDMLRTLNAPIGSVNTLGSRIGVLSSQFRGLASAISPVSLSIAGFATAGISLALSAVRSATEMDSLKRGLIAVSGSSERAEAQLVRLREVAKLPGLNFKEAIEGSVRLQSAGISAGLAERALRGFGNALATVGKGSAELEGVTRALSQIQAKGKVQAEEINQIAERLPQIRVLMQAAFGTARTEDIQKLKLSATGFLEAITTQLEKLPQVTGGAQTSFENLQDAAFIALTAIGEKALPPLIKVVGDLTKEIEDNGEGWKQLGRDMAEAIKNAAAFANHVRDVGSAYTYAMNKAKEWGDTVNKTYTQNLPIEVQQALLLAKAGLRKVGAMTPVQPPSAPFEDPYADRAATNARSRFVPPMTAMATNVGGGSEKVKKAKAIIDEVDRWSISELKDIQEFFQRATGRALPFRAGQTGFHNLKGLDHRNAADVGLHPNSPEGQLLINYLRANDIPFRALTEADKKRGVIMTSPHIHIGEPSHAFGKNVRSRREARRDDMLTVPLPGGQLAQVSQYELDAALQNLLTRQFDKSGKPAGLKYSGAVRPTEGGLGGFGGADRLAQQLTSAERSRRAKDEEYLGRWEETSKGTFERVGGAYQALIDRQTTLQAELGDVWRDSLLEREHQELDLIVNLERAEARLAILRSQATDDQLSEQRRLLLVRQEEISLTERLQQLQDEDATMGANAVLRQQIALMEELNALKRADYDAVESQIRSQARLDDAGVLHTEQVRAAVMGHMAEQQTITGAFGESIISVYDRIGDAIYAGVSKLTGGVRELDGILTSIIRQVTNKLFQKFLDALFPSGNSSTGAQTGGGIFSSLTGGFSGGQGGGGFLGNTSGGITGIIRNIFGGGASVGGSSLSSPVSLSGSGAASSGLGALASVFGGSGGTAARASGFSLRGLGASLGGSLGSLAPLLGLGLGSSLGGRAGGLLGTIGGGILGGIGGLLGGGALLTSLTGVGAFSSMGALSAFAPVLSAIPFLAPIAGALLIGGIIQQRNAQRRRDETTRNTLGTDIRTKLYDLIAQVRSDRIDGAGALSQYQTIRAEYVQQVQALKDRKTRDHAMAYLVNDLEGQVLPLLRSAIEEQGKRKSRLARMQPEFADGGGVWSAFGGRDGGVAHPAFASTLGLQPFGSGIVPGAYTGKKDDTLIRVSKREVVLTEPVWKPISGYLKARGVRGFETGGAVDEATAQRIVASVGSPSGGAPQVNLSLNVAVHGGAMKPEEVADHVENALQEMLKGREFRARVCDAVGSAGRGGLRRNPGLERTL